MSHPSFLNVETVENLIKERASFKLIDVRTPAEFESVHIEGSFNLPLDLLPKHCEELRDYLNVPLIIVCQSGARAQQAERILRGASFTNLHILEGGVARWSSMGKPVVRGKQRWSLERQVRGLAGSLVLLSVIASLFWKPMLLIAAFVGAGLTFSALTNFCGLAFLLCKLPYNQDATCDIGTLKKRLAAE